jgi:hypothetical protein
VVAVFVEGLVLEEDLDLRVEKPIGFSSSLG